jgi:molybdopterin molybdotransferase
VASIGAGPRSLSFAEARRAILDAVTPLATEVVPLSDARGRALRESVRAEHPLPPFTNSSMDGFAVRADDLAVARVERPIELPVVDVIPAGRLSRRVLERAEAARIMTGAPIPEGADAVVPFEECERSSFGTLERVRFTRPVARGANVRDAGADLSIGDEALTAGREISPHDIALLAALGRHRIPVGARPRVAILSTGDELLRVDEPLREGAIRDSNVPMLEALLDECGCRVSRAERVSDDPSEVARRLHAAFEAADAVLTIGGVSAGDFDPVKQSLGDLGNAELWRVAMKPGRPQAFGVVDGKLFHGLPGNPASVACVFEALTRPALRKLQGFMALDRPRLDVRAAVAIESREGRTDFVRVTLARRDGAWWAHPAGEPISGHLTPQSRAHALLVVPEALAVVPAGDSAEALLLRWPEDMPG